MTAYSGIMCLKTTKRVRVLLGGLLVTTSEKQTDSFVGAGLPFLLGVVSSQKREICPEIIVRAHRGL